MSRLHLKLTAVLLVIALRLVFWPLPTPADNFMYFQMGRMMLDGGIPYVDFTDINPPLIMYLGAIQALLSNCSGLPAEAAIQISIFLLLVFFSILLAAVVNLTRGSDKHLLAEKICLAFPIIACSLPDSFGRKDQFLFMAMVPYMVLHWSQLDGSTHEKSKHLLVTALVGFSLGLTLCLKPYFAFPILVAELAFFLIKRRLSLPLLTYMALPAALYGLHFVFVPASMNVAFFQELVPLVVNGYDTYKMTLEQVIVCTTVLGYTPLILITTIAAWRLREKCSLLIPWAAATTACYFLHWFQRSIWLVHSAPFLGMMFTLILMLVAIRFAHARSAARFMLRATAFSAALFLAFLPNLAWRAIGLAWVNPLEQILSENVKRGDIVCIASTRLHFAYPLVLTMGLKEGSRYTYLFAIPLAEYALQHPQSAAQKNWLVQQEDTVKNNFCRDVIRTRPSLIALENSDCVGLSNDRPLSSILKQGKLATFLSSDYMCIAKKVGPFEVWKRLEKTESAIH